MTALRRRVLVTTTNLAPEGGSATGAAGNAWRLVFTELGRHVDGVVLAPRAEDAPAREHIGGLDVRRFRPARPVASLEDSLRGTGMLRVGALAGRMWLETRLALRRERFDLVHAFWAFPSGWAATTPTSGLPTIVSCPGSDLHAWAERGPIGGPVRSTLRRATLVAPTATAGVEQALRLGARRAEAVPICFDPDAFRLDASVPSEPTIAYAGRLVASKGVFVLADALRILACSVPDVRLLVCGTGPDAGAFKRAARAAIGDRAELLGALPPSGVAATMARARVTVLPSFGEGMSASAVESLAVGRPVVTTDTGDHIALVRRGGGRVTPVGDAGSLAEALVAELATQRRPSDVRSVVTHLTPEAVADRILALYERALEGAEPAGFAHASYPVRGMGRSTS